ncbi:MAG: EAL domain-containing protein [Acidimicrobiales bacterium]|nr:EAL domain-containing protein [Acidimicrobiales bacterium]
MFDRVRRARPKTRTLRWAWTLTVVEFLAIVVAVMVIAVAAVQYQHGLFSDSTNGLEEETASLVALDRSVLEATGYLTVVLYRAVPPDALASAQEGYEEARTRVTSAFERVEVAVHSDAERALLAEARGWWEQVDEAVQASNTEYTDEELMVSLARGDDPFMEAVWEPYDELDLALADLRSEVVADMRARLGEADRARWALLPAFGLTAAAAIAITIFAVRRMSREVLNPLGALDRAARSMRDIDRDDPMEVQGAVEEVSRLADTLTETSRSLRMSSEQLQRQARTDELTTLANRKAFIEGLRQMLDDPAGRPVAVLFVDIDEFKDANDSMGHAAGDELLRIMGLRLQSATRAGELAARLGGDEFAVAAHLDDDVTVATSIAERVLAMMHPHIRLGDLSLHVTTSIGVAVSDPGMSAVDAERILANADFAMYMAKRRGKNRYELHSTDLHAEMLVRMGLRRDLADALQEDQFELHYQPVIDLQADELLGFEALLRWRHPGRGMVAPNDFIDIAEDTGAIVEIGAWVLDQACATLAELHRDDPHLVMSVNVSPRQLNRPDFAGTVLDVIRTHEIPPDRLALEITEATAMTNTADGVAQLEELRSHGVHIALDDFGTGFSSLRYLGDLPADVIKIDRSFVAGRTVHQHSTLESIITLAQRLGLQVVAEGIETPEDLERLLPYGQIYGQGYLLARPMPAADINRYRNDRAERLGHAESADAAR